MPSLCVRSVTGSERSMIPPPFSRMRHGGSDRANRKQGVRNRAITAILGFQGMRSER